MIEHTREPWEPHLLEDGKCSIVHWGPIGYFGHVGGYGGQIIGIGNSVLGAASPQLFTLCKEIAQIYGEKCKICNVKISPDMVCRCEKLSNDQTTHERIIKCRRLIFDMYKTYEKMVSKLEPNNEMSRL